MLLTEAGVFDGRRTDTADGQARDGREAMVFARDDADLRTAADLAGVRAGSACAPGSDGWGSLSALRGDALGGAGCRGRRSYRFCQSLDAGAGTRSPLRGPALALHAFQSTPSH